MSNTRKGHDYEREVKAMFIEHGWRCTRAAKSNEPADTIAYAPTTGRHVGAARVFRRNGYWIEPYSGPASPFSTVAVRKTQHNIRKTFFVVVSNIDWSAVLMQQKIYKRRRTRKASGGARG